MPAPAVKAEPSILTAGVPVERSLTPARPDEIPLDLEAGFYVRLGFDGRGVELKVSLLGPGGEVVTQEEGSSEGRLFGITAVTGRHRLVVTSPLAVACRYQVLVLQQRRAVLPDDERRLKADVALRAARQEKDPGKAVQQAEVALKLWSDLRDEDGIFETLDGIRASDGKNAIPWYEKALTQAQSTGNLWQQAKVRTDLGEALSRQRRFDEAGSHLKAALPFWRNQGDSYQQVRSLYYLGVGSDSRGSLDEALGFYEQALKLSDPAWDLSPDIWAVLGKLYVARGESQKALSCLEQGLQLAESQHLEGVKASILTGLGFLHRRRGEHQKALERFQEAEGINRSDPDLDRQYTRKVLLNIGAVYQDIGQPEEALRIYQQALDESQRNQDPSDIATVLVQIGQIELATAQNHEAMATLQKALAIARDMKNPKTQGAALHFLGVAHLKLGQLAEAAESLQAALPLREQTDRLSVALTEQKLGEIYQAQRDFTRADSSLRGALAIASEVGASFFQVPIDFDLAQLARQRGDLREALLRIENAIQVLESVRYDLFDDRLRTSFFASRRSYYDFYVNLLMELDRLHPGQGFADRALTASEQGRARALLDLLAEARFELTRGISAELREKEKDVRARLSQIQHQLEEERLKKDVRAAAIGDLERRLQETELEQTAVEKRIKQESPLYAQLRYPSPLQRENLQRLLQPDEALLEYSLGEEGVYLFVVTSEALTVHPIPRSLAQIGEDVETVRATVEKGGQLTNAYRQVAHRLYKDLIIPALAEIHGKRRLLIAPDGFLHHLAFEALLDREARMESECHFLIENWAVSYIPSASVLSSLSETHPAVTGIEPLKKFIAFAPAYGLKGAEERTRNAQSESEENGPRDAALPDLEGARQEVAAISRLYPEPAFKIYMADGIPPFRGPWETGRGAPRAVEPRVHGWSSPREPDLQLGAEHGSGRALGLQDRG
jgi:tetratricopeptide (TPR) repeat protein